MTAPAMQGSRELDAEVAQKVFGWTTVMTGYTASIPEYSTDMAAAWLVVEKLMDSAFQVSVGVSHESSYFCYIVREESNGGDVVEADCPSAPLAICRAALSTLEGA